MYLFYIKNMFVVLGMVTYLDEIPIIEVCY
jgi:hypothetical protein